MTRMAGELINSGFPRSALDLQSLLPIAHKIAPGKQLAAGDEESETVARLVPAAMMMRMDPAAVVKEYVAARNSELYRSGLTASDPLDARGPWILPSQWTQHQRGGPELPWQYPFQRQDLVEAGLLPARRLAPQQGEVALPVGMSVLEAIRAGVIR